MKLKFVIGLTILALSATSYALEGIVGKVSVLEATAMPAQITFYLDAGNATCPTGTWLKWQKPDPENNKAVYAALMASLASGKQIRFYINNGDTTCTGQFIHLLN